MNRAIAAIYAVTITTRPQPSTDPAAAYIANEDLGGLSPEQKDAVIARIPALIHEIERLEAIVDDPIIHGYLNAKERGMLLLWPTFWESEK